MSYLNLIIKKLRMRVVSKNRMQTIVPIVIFIMFVNILTCLQASVEVTSSSNIRHIPINQDDLQEKTSLDNQQQLISSITLRPSSLPSIKSSNDTHPMSEEVASKDQQNHRNDELSNTTFIVPANETTTASSVTVSPQDEEDDLKLYQRFIQSLEDVTTLPSIEEVTAESDQYAIPNPSETTAKHSTGRPQESSDHEAQRGNISTTPRPFEVLQTAETQPDVSSNLSVRTNQTASVAHKSTQVSQLSNASLQDVNHQLDQQPMTESRPTAEHQIVTDAPFLNNGFMNPEDFYSQISKPPATPNVTTLLHILRHLNLHNGRPNIIDTRADSSNRRQLTSLLLPSKFTNWLSDDLFRRLIQSPNTRLTPLELSTAETSSVKVDQPMKRDLPPIPKTDWTHKMKDDTSRKWTTLPTKKMPTTGVKEESSSNKDQVANKNTKYSLKSPYTANFDSGIPLRNISYLKAAILPDRGPSAESQEVLSMRPRPVEKSKHTQGKAPDSVEENLTRRGLPQVSVNQQLPDKEKQNILPKFSGVAKYGLQNQAVITSKGLGTQLVDENERSRRGERTPPNKKGSFDVVRADGKAHKPLKGYTDENSRGKLDNPLRASQGIMNSNNIDNRFFNDKPSRVQFTHQSSPSNVDNAEAFSRLPYQPPNDQIMANDLNFQSLTEAIRKTLFHSEEPRFGIDELPQPVSIGDYNHGVPFRLRPAPDESYHVGPTDEFNYAQESNQYEDYLNTMQYNRNNIIGANNLKFNDELKKKLAIQTVEALTRNPDLSVSLFNNPENIGQVSDQNDLPAPNMYQLATSNQMPMNVLPIGSVPEQTYLSSPPAAEHAMTNLQSNSSNPVNLMVSDIPYRWALSRMPDLIPIPLAATVPGYLIKLSNGQILAAALTNSFSIQGIQKGPLSSGYKNFLNQSLKKLIKPSRTKHINSPGHFASNSGISSIVLPAPQRYTPQGGSKGSSEKGGLFSRSILSQLGFSRSNQRPSSTREPNKNKNNKQKPKKSNSSLFEGGLAPINDHDFSASTAINNFNEPVFSFADESQIIETPDFSSLPPTVAPLLNPESPDLYQSDTALALKAKLNQLLSIRNIFGDDVVRGAKKRRSPPPGGFEPPTFWLTAKRASRLRHGGICL